MAARRPFRSGAAANRGGCPFLADRRWGQGSFGFVTQNCQPVQTLPQGLQPPPPEGANAALVCRVGLFGLPTAHVLEVSAVTRDGAMTTTFTQAYTLDADGNPNNAITLDLAAVLILFIYVIACEALRGATVGKVITRIRTIRRSQPDHIGVGVKIALLREIAKHLALIPGLLLYQWMLWDMSSVQQSGLFFPLLAVGLALVFAWFVWIIVDVARKRDPIYDRLAGTAVLRRQ
ncbi:RDD family protein [Corticibacterium sp. UT-5YL-CI-8]|nr:RDD family protein [Tianweitania sp. UT-5YL-CI-8]